MTRHIFAPAKFLGKKAKKMSMFIQNKNAKIV